MAETQPRQSPETAIFQVKYEIYQKLEDLLVDDQQLLVAASWAMEKAYAPYSGFHVGAALRLRDGSMIVGSNQENASYGLTICAERSALVSAGSQGHGSDIVQLAVIGSGADFNTTEPVLPCGACRQWIKEAEDRAGDPISIIASGKEGKIYKFEGISNLLPLGFGPKDLHLGS